MCAHVSSRFEITCNLKLELTKIESVHNFTQDGYDVRGCSVLLLAIASELTSFLYSLMICVFRAHKKSLAIYF